MNKYYCELCDRDFNTKYDLERHLKKKNKCNDITKYHCNNCDRYFRSNQYLKVHSEKCIEVEKKENKKDDINIINDIKNAIRSIIESDDDLDVKCLLLSKYKLNLSESDIKILLSSKMETIGKIDYIYTNIVSTNDVKTSIATNSHNNISNSNNTTNNIQINQFGKEDISYLDQEYFKKLLKHDRNLENQLITLTKDIHLRLDHPENRNIKVTNLNNRYATVFNNGKWRGMTKESLKEELHKKNIKLIKVHYDQLKDVLNDKHKNNIKILLGRDLESDPVLREISDKMILLFYSKDE